MVPTNKISIQTLIDTHNVLIGAQRVFDESLVPGTLSFELHNARMHNNEMIKSLTFQIQQMRELGRVKATSNAVQKQKKSLKKPKMA
jgi:hypothetical protein